MTRRHLFRHYADGPERMVNGTVTSRKRLRSNEPTNAAFFEFYEWVGFGIAGANE
jgi:hypothetical protein